MGTVSREGPCLRVPGTVAQHGRPSLESWLRVPDLQENPMRPRSASCVDIEIFTPGYNHWELEIFKAAMLKAHYLLYRAVLANIPA